MIYENKLLFQAGSSQICLGQSATNCHAYLVLVYHTPMIVCTNNFWEGVTPAAQEYLQENIVYHHVTEICWQPEDDHD